MTEKDIIIQDLRKELAETKAKLTDTENKLILAKTSIRHLYSLIQGGIKEDGHKEA